MLNLKKMRKEAGLSAQALANLSGVPRRTIEDIERRGDCRVSTAYVLCKTLNRSLDDFYTEESESADDLNSEEASETNK